MIRFWKAAIPAVISAAKGTQDLIQKAEEAYKKWYEEAPEVLRYTSIIVLILISFTALIGFLAIIGITLSGGGGSISGTSSFAVMGDRCWIIPDNDPEQSGGALNLQSNGDDIWIRGDWEVIEMKGHDWDKAKRMLDRPDLDLSTCYRPPDEEFDATGE